jgi:hypothetical protein
MELLHIQRGERLKMKSFVSQPKKKTQFNPQPKADDPEN